MKKRKILSLTLAALILLVTLLTAIPASAVAEMTDGYYKYTVLENGTAEITQYTAKEESIAIPEKIGQYEVSGIGKNAFRGCQTIKSVTFSDNIESIGDYAFDCCTNLLSIEIPENVESIGKGAFYSCTRLEKVTLNEGIQSIGDGAFYDCQSLKAVSVPDSAKSVGDYAFGRCYNLTSVNLGNGLENISNQMFIECTSLSEITIPDSVKSIGRKAFKDCSSIENIYIPDSVKNLGSEAFFGCSSLQSIYVPCEEIGSGAFGNCTYLKSISLTDNLKSIKSKAFFSCGFESIDIPKSVTEIEYGAFAVSNLSVINIDSENEYFTSSDSIVYNIDMTEIIAYPPLKDNRNTFEIPDSVKSIAPYAFCCCWALETVVIPDSVESIGEYAFYNAGNLTYITVPGSVEKIENNTFSGCQSLNSLTLSEGIKSIGIMAFEECCELTNILLPESLESLNPTAFYMSGVIDFLVPSESKFFTSVNGVLYSKDKTELVAYPVEKEDESFSIPDGTESIGEYAFANNNFLKSVYIPDSVTSFGKNSLGLNLMPYSGEYDRINEFIIYGNENSAAADYALENDITFFTDNPGMNKENVSLGIGESFTLEISNADISRLAFTSSDERVASVDQSGKITGLSKGTTTVIANIGTFNFVCNVSVYANGKTALENSNFDTGKYRKLNINDFGEWENSYYEFNKSVSTDMLDNSNICYYSGSDFVPIFGVQKGGIYLETVKKTYGDDYGQYEIMADNLSLELGRYSLNTDLVLYSGTDDISLITGSNTSSVKSLKESIGKRFTDPGVISTSIAHSAAAPFGMGSNHTMLEIYAPKDSTRGGYIKKFSKNPQEYELLLDSNTEFEVIDTGVRQVKITNFNGGDEYEETERYIKLLIVNTPEIEPTTVSPTESTSSAVETTATSSAVTTQPATSGTIQNTSNPSDKPVSTGDNGFTFISLITLTASISICICIYFRRRKER